MKKTIITGLFENLLLRETKLLVNIDFSIDYFFSASEKFLYVDTGKRLF